MKINGETLLYYYNKEVNWMLETRGETWIFLCVYKEILTLCTLLLVILKLFTFVLTHAHENTHTWHNIPTEIKT